MDSLGGLLRELDDSDPTSLAALARVREECRLAKEALSEDTDVAIPVMLPNVQTEVRLTRAEFESIVRPRIADTVAALERTVRGAGLTFDDVSRVLLVGGTSRIPLIGEMVRDAMGRPAAVDAHPKHAIALGAAAHGATLLEAAPEPAHVVSEALSGRLLGSIRSRATSRIALAATGAVIVLVAAVAGFAFLGDDDDGAPTLLSATPTATTDPATPTLSADGDGPDAEIRLGESTVGRNILHAPNEGDGIIRLSTRAGRDRREVVESGTPTRYFYFDISDELAEGAPPTVEIEVEYFDDVLGLIGLSYDSLSDPFMPSRNEDLTSSMTWKTAVYLLDDARFENREQSSFDFRISIVPGGHELCVGRVAVRFVR